MPSWKTVEDECHTAIDKETIEQPTGRYSHKRTLIKMI